MHVRTGFGRSVCPQTYTDVLVRPCLLRYFAAAPTFCLSEGFPGPHESTAVRLSRSDDASGHRGIHGRPHVSTAVVSAALARSESAACRNADAARSRVSPREPGENGLLPVDVMDGEGL